MLDQKFVSICRQKLISAKSDLLNRFHTYVVDFRQRETSGDEADQSSSLQAENQLLATQQRLRQQLLEIESALMRIEKGTFGICEETEEPIEKERLLAIPWTRLSIEGAEIRETSSSVNSSSRRA
jgi:DnaK suppressor protein